MLKYHCFTYHIHSSFEISVSCSPKAALPQNFIFGILLFFFFYCVEIQFYSRSKFDVYFTCSPLKAAAGLLALSPLVSSNAFPFSPSPLPLKWPEFENHLLSGWGVLAVLFQFVVAGAFCSISILSQLHTPETQPGRTRPAKSVHSEWCASLSLLKPKSPGGKYPAECVKEGMLERLWLSRHLLALWSVLPPPASVVSSCFL